MKALLKIIWEASGKQGLHDQHPGPVKKLLSSFLTAGISRFPTNVGVCKNMYCICLHLVYVIGKEAIYSFV